MQISVFRFFAPLLLTPLYLVIGGSLQYTHEQLINISRFNSEDITQIRKCRQEHNRLGFGYQLAFVRLLNRFPTQTPFEVADDILAYVSIQLSISSERLDTYNKRQPTVSNHQETIRKYLGLIRFTDADPEQLNRFLFEEACRIGIIGTSVLFIYLYIGAI